MNYTKETWECIKITEGTIADKEHELGMQKHEPIIVIIDRLIYYAKAYEKRFENKIASDGFCFEPFAMMLSGVKAMLNMQGGYAMKNGISTDSKDNGTCYNMIEKCCVIAGINYNEL